MSILYTAFYTAGTLYEQEAARLRRSLDRLGLDHDIRAVADRGDWMKNSQLTAGHIWTMLEAYPDRPVVQLDADAVVWQRPVLLERLAARYVVDVALHRRRGVEWLNGTVYFAPTPAARGVARRYLDLILANPGCTNEQTMLARAIEELAGHFTLDVLPAELCFIPDIMANDVRPGTEIVISHFQASRQARCIGGEPQARRSRWVEDAERKLTEWGV